MTPAGRRGHFLTFEGIEGSGKTTQMALLARRLEEAGADPVLTREPGGTELGRRLRALLLATDAPAIGALGELLLYATDRAQHLEEVVIPALDAGRLVLCDRYLDATLAYQGFGRGIDCERIYRLHREPPLDLRPDRTVLLDLDPAVALGRARERNRAESTAVTEGRFEAEELAFHERVRHGYLELARQDPERFRVVSAVGTAETVMAHLLDQLRDLLPLEGTKR